MTVMDVHGMAYLKKKGKQSCLLRIKKKKEKKKVFHLLKFSMFQTASKRSMQYHLKMIGHSQKTEHTSKHALTDFVTVSSLSFISQIQLMP